MSPLFEYSAYDLSNNFFTDKVNAADLKAARALIRDQGLYPVQVKEISETIKISSTKEKIVTKLQSIVNEATEVKEKLSKLDVKVFNFQYTAHTLSGIKTIGEIEAHDLREARTFIRNMDLFPVDIQIKSTPLVSKKFGNFAISVLEKFFPPRINLKEVSLFTHQLAAMLEAGIPLPKALDLGEKNVKDNNLKNALKDVKGKIEGGSGFHVALAAHKHLFPPSFLELITAGEIGGTLETNLQRLAEYLTAQLELRQKLQGAMAYPVVVLCLIILITAILLTMVVPQFKKIFKEFNLDLPLPTQILMAISNFILSAWWSIPLIIIFFIWFLKITYDVPYIRNFYQRIIMSTPLIGPVLYKIIIARIVYTLGLSVKAGLSIAETLNSIIKNLDNIRFQAKLSEIVQGIEKGEKVSTLFDNASIFPSVVTHLFTIGEETGNIDEMMHKAASYLDNEVNVSIKSLISAMEPLLTVALGLIVGFIIFSLYIPIFTLIQKAGSIRR